MTSVRGVRHLAGILGPKKCWSHGLFLNRTMSNASEYKFETLNVTSPTEFVFNVELNRPEKRNALNKTLWNEIKTCFEKLSVEPECRCIVLSGAGKLFCAGIDLGAMGDSIIPSPELDVARKSTALGRTIANFQDGFTALEKCPKPVIAAIHGGCVGAGVDIVCAADIRYSTEDAWFQIKEVDLGIVADVGTLQRFPKIIGNDSLARELCYSAERFDSTLAQKIGFLSGVFKNKESMLEHVMKLASLIASKSPVAVQGTKQSMVYSRDHSVQESLDHVRLLNQCLLQSEDVTKSVESMMTKQPAKFSKL